ncbi:MAG: response regulator [Lachnospiraceae bacterium]|nr:response regulator [Lachnospiraceae bacterium]
MKKAKNRGLMVGAITGSLIIAAILIVGTIWSGRTSSRDTVKAVRNVSLLYLNELAGRREQVVSEKITEYITFMDAALGVIEKDDLSSVESLRAYQARMKLLYNLEKFAFVDENGLIYTSRGTRTDIDLYSFDPNTISEPEISLKNTEGNDKKVIIAAPVDRFEFEGQTLVACFIEIDMDVFLEALSLKSDTNNTTFCNIYTCDGKALTDLVLGGLSSDDNLLEAIKKASFEDGETYETVQNEFEEGREGVASFTYEGITETLRYVPVHQTDWMLTYLIRESVISEQIQTISDGIIERSLAQSLITALVLLIISGFLIVQTRNATKLATEQASAEAIQQELEERIALQDELLEQEKRRAEQDNIINALSSDYRSVYYVDLDSLSALCLRQNAENDDADGISQGERVYYIGKFTEYAEKYVTEEYHDALLDFIKPESIRKGLKNEQVISLRYLINKNGRVSYEMLRMAGVRTENDDKDDTIHAVVAGFTDIDQEMRDSLSKNQALSDALKAAEEASKAKTVFLSNMSHEIRTPMNMIIGLDSLALNDPDLSVSTKDYLEKIGNSAEHLLGLINDILDMSRIESGRIVLNSEEFSLSEMIEQINTMFSDQCDEKKLTYHSKVSGDLSEHYIGDVVKLKQVLINILGNAVKFTPENGSVSFHAVKKASFDNRSTICFIISYTGIGMSKEYLPKLFDTFGKEDETQINKYGSSGLGMAITRNIVELMNGDIEVESEKGKGTTITVTVTLLDSDNMTGKDTYRASESDGENSKTDTTDLTGKKVLLAEDMQINAEIMVSMLMMRGIECETAEDGQKAVEMFESQPEGYYDAILMDMRMPRMDGLQATAAIRASEHKDAKTIPIIALTANAFDEDVQKSLQAGLNAHLTKPIQPDILFETLEKML